MWMEDPMKVITVGTVAVIGGLCIIAGVIATLSTIV